MHRTGLPKLKQVYGWEVIGELDGEFEEDTKGAVKGAGGKKKE
jgi:hypothetical protein